MVMESQGEAKASLPQVLVINPKNALLFKGPSNQSANVQITLTNPSTKWVAFKVKTTAPKRYCVRPNGGFIKSNESCSVNIAYQPGDGANDVAERLKHKFLVQAIFTDNDQVHLDQIWKDVPKDNIMESKIRCMFEEETGDIGGGQPKGDVLSAPDVTGGGSDTTKSMANTVEAATRTGTANVNQTELELRRMGEDYRRAQDEISNLRDENRRLRDESTRMKKSIQSIGQTSGTSGISSMQKGFGSQEDFVTTLKTDLTKVTTMVALFVAIFVGMIMSKIF